MKNGYVYVLANSSMPGLVKVGMTNIPPDDLAQELSGATGVPTPFIVVYEQFVADCGAAESFVHTILKRKGFRISENRGFFSAPVKEVINAILSLPSEIIATGEIEEEDELIPPSAVDELSALTLIEHSAPHDYLPWWSIWLQAENANFGLGDEIEDHKEALRLYRDCAKLGCNLAYARLADLHSGLSQTIAESSSKEMDYLKEGARKGNYACYLTMAYNFNFNYQVENSLKCLKLFFRDRANQRNELVEQEMHIDIILMSTLSGPVNLTSLIGDEGLLQILEMRDELILVAQEKLERYRAQDGLEMQIYRLEKVHDWLQAL
jgi:hypothetical protein